MRNLRYGIHLRQFLRHCNWSFRTSFLRLGWVSPPKQDVGNNNYHHICFLYLNCGCDTREDVFHYMTDFYNVSIDIGSCSCQRFVHLFCQMILIFLFRLLLPSNSKQERTSVFLFMRFAHSASGSFNLTSSFPMIETTWVSFRTLSRCFPLPAISNFPLNVGFISFWTPCHCSSMNHFFPGFEVSTSHLPVNILSHWCCKSWTTCLSIVSNSFWIIQSQYSLQLSRILKFYLFYPSKTVSISVSFADNSAWSHRTSKSWTSSFWRPVVNTSDSPYTDSYAPAARKYSQIIHAICPPRKNRSYFWARCSSTFHFLRNWTCELRSFFNEDAIITSSIS